MTSDTHWTGMGLRPRLLAFFLALSFFVYGAHEVLHHVTARAVCGRWGTMTLSQFFVPDGCPQSRWWVATLAAPLLTYSLIWAGALVRSTFGTLLFFANLPLARAVSVATGGGDELVLARMAFGEWAWPAAALIAGALLVPPLVMVWKRFPPAGRRWIFPLWLILPVLWDFAFKRMFLSTFLDALPAVRGIPGLAILLYAIAAGLLILFRPRTAQAVAR